MKDTKPIVIGPARVPDPRQGQWSRSHAATVLTFRGSVTVNCDCGSAFHAETKDQAEGKWERHVQAARS
jgi:hypothetical protein